jgi:uncharacterized protein (DUF2267 family)
MQLQAFLGQVQSRAKLESLDSALAATRAILVTLGERLSGNEPEDLAAQLPEELAKFLRQDNRGQRFSSDEFFRRVAERSGADLPDAVFQVRVVFEVLSEAVSKGEIDDIRAQLPQDYQRIFEAGSEGRMDSAG